MYREATVWWSLEESSAMISCAQMRNYQLPITNDHLPDQPKLNLFYVTNIGERIVIRDAGRHAGL